MVEVVVPLFSSQLHFLRHAFFSPFSFISIFLPTLQRWSLQFLTIFKTLALYHGFG